MRPAAKHVTRKPPRFTMVLKARAVDAGPTGRAFPNVLTQSAPRAAIWRCAHHAYRAGASTLQGSHPITEGFAQRRLLQGDNEQGSPRETSRVRSVRRHSRRCLQGNHFLEVPLSTSLQLAPPSVQCPHAIRSNMCVFCKSTAFRAALLTFINTSRQRRIAVHGASTTTSYWWSPFVMPSGLSLKIGRSVHTYRLQGDSKPRPICAGTYTTR